ncbi:sialidase family protein [Verrucomicrobiota bacterium]
MTGKNLEIDLSNNESAFGPQPQRIVLTDPLRGVYAQSGSIAEITRGTYKGSLAVMWQQSDVFYQENHPSVSLRISVSRDAGNSWSSAQEPQGYTHGAGADNNPYVYFDPEREILFCFFMRNMDGVWSGDIEAWCYGMKSMDGGDTWTAPVPIFGEKGQRYQIAPSHIIKNAAGDWVQPIYHSPERKPRFEAGLLILPAGADPLDSSAWKYVSVPNPEGVHLSEMTVVASGKDGKGDANQLWALIRGSGLWESVSRDGGYSWSEPIPDQQLCFNQSKPNLLRLAKGDCVLLGNNISPPQPRSGERSEDRPRRWPLTAFLKKEGSKRFHKARNIGWGDDFPKGQMHSYPFGLELSDGRLAVSCGLGDYTFNIRGYGVVFIPKISEHIDSHDLSIRLGTYGYSPVAERGALLIKEANHCVDFSPLVPVGKSKDAPLITIKFEVRVPGFPFQSHPVHFPFISLFNRDNKRMLVLSYDREGGYGIVIECMVIEGKERLITPCKIPVERSLFVELRCFCDDCEVILGEKCRERVPWRLPGSIWRITLGGGTPIPLRVEYRSLAFLVEASDT